MNIESSPLLKQLYAEVVQELKAEIRQTLLNSQNKEVPEIVMQHPSHGERMYGSLFHEVLSAYKNGLNFVDTAKALKISEPKVRTILSQINAYDLGALNNRRSWNDSDNGQLISLHHQGFDEGEIARELGRSVKSIINQMHHLRSQGRL